MPELIESPLLERLGLISNQAHNCYYVYTVGFVNVLII